MDRRSPKITMVTKKRQKEMLNNLRRMTTEGFGEWLHAQDDKDALYDAFRAWYVDESIKR